MKKILIPVLVIVCFLVLFACGDKGKDGDAHIALEWIYGLGWYWDDNPGIPDVYDSGHYYKTKAGKYHYEYESYEGVYYAGTYRISIEEGGDPILFMDGKDGDDNYYVFWLLDIGPELEKKGESGMQTEPGMKGSSSPAQYTKVMQKSEQPLLPEGSTLEPVVHVIEKRSGNVTVHLEYQKVIQ